MSIAVDLGQGLVGDNFSVNGFSSTYVANGSNNVLNGTTSQTFGGYSTNYGGIVDSHITNGVSNQDFGGYTTTFGAVIGATQSTIQMYNNPTEPHPKSQQIYYKLVGYNTNTQLYETWIISEEIVPQTELYDPTRSPPNIDYGIFFTPPSGHNLSNIRIVGRWIQ